MKKIGILGSTGSIGTQTLDLIENNENFSVLYLTANSNYRLLASQARKFKPKFVCLKDTSNLANLKKELNYSEVEILSGENGIIELASNDNIDLMINALVGYAGMQPTLTAIRNGINVALANKESLVVAGELIVSEINKNKVQLLPVDSEHSAIWQCLVGENINEIDKLILTGSGGPFRLLNFSKFNNISKDDALKHPNWEMGSKITIDSATMMNKGFEVIEAHWLFDVPIDDIEVIIHPQSIIHSMVEFIDGSIKAQIGTPNMTIPINYALNYPNRTNIQNFKYNFKNSKDLTFEEVDFKKFKCIKLAYEALKSGKSYSIVLNVVNDICVDAFLKNKIRFLDRSNFIEDFLNSHKPQNVDSLELIDEVISETKLLIRERIKK